MHSSKRTVLLYGRTRSGKTTQIGQLAEYVFKTSGKRTRLYTTDRGGFDSIRPYCDLGIIDVVEQGDTDPWIFLNKAVRGFVRDGKKWVPGLSDEIGLWAFESLTSHSDNLMNSLALKAAEGLNVGGAANVNFNVSGDNETLKVGGNNMGHYNVVQSRITAEVWESQRLPGLFVLWTASVAKDDDPNASGKVLGPAVCGKALTTEVPRWFGFSFRIDCLPAQMGKGERHILYLGNNVDAGAGNAVGLGNTRTPLDAPDLPQSIEPASLVKAIQLIDDANTKALDIVKKRLGDSALCKS
jgi:hypothetical protein